MQGMHQMSIVLFQISLTYSYHIVFELCASINQPLHILILFGSRQCLFILFLNLDPHLVRTEVKLSDQGSYVLASASDGKLFLPSSLHGELDGLDPALHVEAMRRIQVKHLLPCVHNEGMPLFGFRLAHVFNGHIQDF
jgi:hypothetical protein